MAHQDGVLRLLNPLSIRFSQPRIAPHFRDGHLLEETVKQVHGVAIDDVPAYEDSPDAAEGNPPYDLVLQQPFATIRVISWMPKLRGADGEAERDANGDQILGKRAWFVLDNRRLWTLQRAAAKEWPKRCCAVVRCLEDVPGTTIRELRKFRTTTEGKQVEIGVRDGETKPWSWAQAAPAGARIEEDTLEGLFSEDLWDAQQWAPRAALAACEKDPEDFVPRNSSAAERKQQAAASAAAATAAQPQQNGAASLGSNGGYAASALPAATPGAGLPIAASSIGGGRRGEPAPCPETGWEYMDPVGRRQGPFERKKMRLWHEHGYFYGDLLMRSCPQDAFVPFSVLFPQPAEPFLGYVMRYKLQ